MKNLGSEIEEYREIQKVEKEKKALELILYLMKMEMNNRELEKYRQEKRAKMDEREKIQGRKEKVNEEHENNK